MPPDVDRAVHQAAGDAAGDSVGGGTPTLVSYSSSWRPKPPPGRKRRPPTMPCPLPRRCPVRRSQPTRGAASPLSWARNPPWRRLGSAHRRTGPARRADTHGDRGRDDGGRAGEGRQTRRPVAGVAARRRLGPGRAAPGAARAPAGAPAPPVVEGDVPDRRRLLLHARLPAGHRGAGRRAALADRDPGAGAGDPARRAAGLPAGGRGEPARRGLHRDAGAAADLLAGQAVRAGAARFRGDRLHHHHHPVGGRRDGAHRREPVLAERRSRATRCWSRWCWWRCWARCSSRDSPRPSGSPSSWSRSTWR